MKATVTIEIEGSKEEIDSISNKLSNFVKREKDKIKMHPIKNMYPKGYTHSDIKDWGDKVAKRSRRMW